MLGLNGGLTAGVAVAVVMALAVRPVGGAATGLPLFCFFPAITSIPGMDGDWRMAAWVETSPTLDGPARQYLG